MKEQTPFVSHRGVTIYQAIKGRAALGYGYSLEPCQNEDSVRVFDVRRLPGAYVSGLVIEYAKDHSYDALDVSSDEGRARFRKIIEEHQGAHRMALLRAIDHGYDFSSAARGNYAQFLRRVIRFVRRIFARQAPD